MGEAEEEETEADAGHAYTAARTHLVIEMEGEEARAELRAWDETGPRLYERPAPPRV